MSETPAQPAAPAPALSPANDASRSQLVERYLEQQGKEIAIRAQELENQRQKDDNALEFGKAALAAQADDRKHGRECKVRELRHRYRFILLTILVVCGLVFGAMYLGQTQVAIEIAKSVALLCAGGLGGYGYAKGKQPESNDQDSD